MSAPRLVTRALLTSFLTVGGQAALDPSAFQWAHRARSA